MEEPKKSVLREIFDVVKIPTIAGFATFIGDMLAYPTETLTTRFKIKPHKIRLMKDLSYVSVHKGLKYLGSGFDTVFYSAFFTNFVYFFVYEALNHRGMKFLNEYEMYDYSYMLPTLSSFVAEALSLLVYVPVDCVQTRIQSGNPKYRYTSTFNGLSSIFMQEGFGRFFAGSYLYVIHNLIYTPFIFTIYEKGKVMISDMKRDKLLKSGISITSDTKLFPLHCSMIVTCFATTIATLITNPIYTILVRYQMTNFENFQNLNMTGLNIVINNLKAEGFQSLLRGSIYRLFVANCSAMVFIPTYEIARQYFGVEIDFN